MPIVPIGKVLVTGANGYIAAWVVRTLLEKGYSVRGTVRSEQKGLHLKKIFASYKEKFETVVVEDITKEGAFDEAVKGVDAIEHTASPFHFKADDPKELITPAVNGTISVLKSALSIPSVRRIVVTSSVASILEDLPAPKVFSESDWNEQAIIAVNTEGNKASPANKYRASKTLAEKAAWEVYNANKGKISWDLVTLCPPMVYGPGIHDVSSPSALGTSAADWYNSVVRPNSGGKPIQAITSVAFGYVDVRDIAMAHALALQKEDAGGERLIIINKEFVFQDFIDIANSLSPSPIPSHTDLPKGSPGAGKGFQPMVTYDRTKTSKIFPELKYHTMEETTKDTLEDLSARVGS
ncbi:hypothetical protein BDP27DRAFT_1395161 [Rhodocollybia butyracea]|uniref:NAD-dependent epimerase/dehydratase domain-containing protein n=1 Tax=Rhodocollybia butyracea TaxID=206335 RepID=A0A9P5P698_9AGAR|nr:hypothetical protein BDP27DRAFT_1395161 [Rhodocollybia butyracea]